LSTRPEYRSMIVSCRRLGTPRRRGIEGVAALVAEACSQRPPE
jgi:hypothetical protein